MRRGRRMRIAAVTPLLGLTVLVASGSRTPGAASSARVGSTADVHSCVPADTHLSLGPQLVPKTGEHANLFVLTNRSGRSCVVDGYPQVRLSDRAGGLPFIYAHGGGLT